MEPTPEPINIFISYSWADKKIADQVEKDLGQMRIRLIRDVRDVSYRESLSDFMKSIREADFSLLLISESYLKSKNCMTEVLHLLKERDYAKKILPVIVGTVMIYNPLTRLEYTKYWKDEKDKLDAAIKEVTATAVLSSLKDLQIIEKIYSEINEFLGYVVDIKHMCFEDLRNEGYKSIFDVIGFKDVTNLVELLIITFIKDIEKKEIELDNWFEKHAPTSDAFSIRASIARDKGQIERAKANYRKAIDLNDKNAYALNNFGYLLQRLDIEPENSRELFERAIQILPNLTEARLNLGCLLSGKFGDYEKAREQYEAIIEYNPTEERAYNNLANIFRNDRPFSKTTMKKVCDLYELALKLNPEYIEAYIGYGNYLCDFIGNYDLAEHHFKMAASLNEKVKGFVEALLKHLNMLKNGEKRKFESGKTCPCGSGINYENCCLD